jgi:AraC-like DNA-binding protein
LVHYLYYFVMTLPASHRHAVVVHANYAQFAPGQVIQNGPVGSRMLLWCRAGTGRVIVNKHSVPLDAGCLLVLPWGHTIRYEASKDDPFLLAGIHLIPRHETGHPVQFEVPHTAHHPLAGVAWRRPVRLAGIPEFKVGRLIAGSALAHLLEYVVGVFIRGKPPEWQARQLAGLVLTELAAYERSPLTAVGPPELERMKEYIEFHMAEPVSLSDLATFARLSPSTVGRLFRQHLGTTPVTWILRVKVERARRLLRTRRLTVEEVAAEVGFTDPYYFSRCFKKQTGQTPRAYRQSGHWL